MGTIQASASTTAVGQPAPPRISAMLPDSDHSTAMAAPHEMSMLPVMMIIEMPMAATAM